MTHNYTLVAESPTIKLDKMYLTRSEAVKKMYEIIESLNLKVSDIWLDRHDVTYICTDNTRFHINRWM